MASTRGTRHCGRKGKASHNDRQFDISKADHIDETKTSQNFYQHCYQDTEPELSFEQAEKKYYQEHYSQALQKQNERYIQQRHTERVKTIDDLYKSKAKQPCENILQIGNKDNHCAGVTPDLLMQIYNRYREKFDAWNDAHGGHVHVLSVAMHCDETSPHLHERIVFDYMTDEGLKLEQKKALEMAGVPLPDPTKKESRYNNRKMTFDKEMRGLWIETCREFGIDIIEEPLPTHKHKDKEEYIDDQIQKKSVLNDNLQKENDTLQKEIDKGQKAKERVEPYIVADYYEPKTKKNILGQNIISNEELFKLMKRSTFVEASKNALETLEQSKEIISNKESIIENAKSTASKYKHKAKKNLEDAEQKINDANEQAKQIINDANEQAKQIIHDAEMEANSRWLNDNPLEQEVKDLQNELSGYENVIRAIQSYFGDKWNDFWNKVLEHWKREKDTKNHDKDVPDR